MGIIKSDDSVNIDPTIDCFGDSLTDGAGSGTPREGYPVWLSRLLPDRIINNYGIGGQTLEQIGARQGAIPCKITIPGNVLNGYNEVNLTSISPQLGSTAADQLDRYFSGKVNGIPVVIKRTGASEVYTIKCLGTTTGATISPNSVFVPDSSRNARSHIQILFWGRNNNVFNIIPSLTAAYESAVNYMESPKRVLIIGILNAMTETVGTGAYNAIIACNDTLRSIYKDRYVEITPPTVEELSAIDISPTSQDLADIGNGIFPASMHADNTHLLGTGYRIIANRIYAKMVNLRWA